MYWCKFALPALMEAENDEAMWNNAENGLFQSIPTQSLAAWGQIKTQHLDVQSPWSKSFLIVTS